GERTRLFHWSYPGLFDEERATFLVWRQGGAVAAVFAAGGDGAANDATALALAQRQQHHLEEPEPFSPAEFDDTEVPLENPAIEIPIYWLGRDLAARSGLLALHLQNTSSSSPAETGRPRAGTYYEDRPLRARGEGVYVDVYSAAQWKRFKARGHLPGALECGATAHPIELPQGHAVAFHGRARLFRRCDRREPEPTEWVLRARVGGVVVTASTIESCATCAEPGRGPYNSYKGMRAIARGLELRSR
ncbi:MAG TPA: hypothetical protein VFB52_04060, partial [Solirubrobacterales bacterium]|nr:hypothetical protein [Solirubrobacterales bacterium]